VTRFDNVAAVLFDLDETLIHNTVSFEALCSDAYDAFEEHVAAVSRGAFWDTFWTEAIDNWDRMIEGALEGEIAHRNTFVNTLRALGLDEALAAPMAAYLDERQAQGCRLLYGADQVLALLRAAGIRLAIVTNGYGTTQRRKIERHGLEERVDAVVISAEAGIHKPDKAIFDFALAAIGAPASRSVFVGDTPEADIMGARGAGMRAVLMDHAGLWQSAEGGVADPGDPFHHRIERLPDLLPLLRMAESD
jgi:putative hydrolase of the HAD superfamily